MAIALQFRILQSAIEFIKTTANQDQKLSGSVQVPTSPHHAIYQKRKSIAGQCNTAACGYPVKHLVSDIESESSLTAHKLPIPPLSLQP